MDVETSLKKLQEKQQEGLQICMEKINKWTKVKDDYSTLVDKITNINIFPKQEIIVPLGTMLLVPGHYEDPDKILVHIGDGYFIHCTSEQAKKIAERRIAQSDAMIAKLKQEEILFRSWMSVTEQTRSESVQLVDLKEFQTEEEDKAWRELHRQKVKEYKQSKAAKEERKTPEIDDEELWLKLEMLELEERYDRNGDDVMPVSHLDSSTGSIPIQDPDVTMVDVSEPTLLTPVSEEDSVESAAASKKRHVKWEDQKLPGPSTITVSHLGPKRKKAKQRRKSEGDTPCESHSPYEQSPVGTPTIQSPADIFKYFSHPKSILKKPRRDTGDFIDLEEVDYESYFGTENFQAAGDRKSKENGSSHVRFAPVPGYHPVSNKNKHRKRRCMSESSSETYEAKASGDSSSDWIVIPPRRKRNSSGSKSDDSTSSGKNN